MEATSDLKLAIHYISYLNKMLGNTSDCLDTGLASSVLEKLGADIEAGWVSVPADVVDFLQRISPDQRICLWSLFFKCDAGICDTCAIVATCDHGMAFLKSKSKITIEVVVKTLYDATISVCSKCLKPQQPKQAKRQVPAAQPKKQVQPKQSKQPKQPKQQVQESVPQAQQFQTRQPVYRDAQLEESVNQPVYRPPVQESQQFQQLQQLAPPLPVYKAPSHFTVEAKAEKKCTKLCFNKDACSDPCCTFTHPRDFKHIACTYGSNCTRPGCFYSHPASPTPTSAAPSNYRAAAPKVAKVPKVPKTLGAKVLCNFDGRCTNTACTFMHLQQTGPIVSAVATTVCKFDGKCSNTACTFTHKNQTGPIVSAVTTTVCKNNGYCNVANCKFLHPPTDPELRETVATPAPTPSKGTGTGTGIGTYRRMATNKRSSDSQ